VHPVLKKDFFRVKKKLLILAIRVIIHAFFVKQKIGAFCGYFRERFLGKYGLI